MAPLKAMEEKSSNDLLRHQILVERCMGNIDLVQRLLVRYRDTGRRDCEQLEAALKAEDPLSLASIAHRLKGSSATIGSDRMAELASSIEKQSPSKDWSALESLVTELRELQRHVDQECLKKIGMYQATTPNGGGE